MAPIGSGFPDSRLGRRSMELTKRRPVAGDGQGTTSTVWVLVAALVVFIVLAVLIQFGATLLIRHNGPLSAADQLTATNSARVSLIQLLGGLGLVGGLIFTARTYLLTRHTQRADRFAKAVEQVGDKGSETVRAGGAFNLWLLAQEAASYWPVVEWLLATMIREHSTQATLSRSDVQAGLTVFGERPLRDPGEKGRPIDLRAVDLSGLSLTGGNFERVLLDRAQLIGTQLTDTNLVRANLNSAHLDRAILSGADLTNAVLTGASLTGANLFKTVLRGSNITDCDFTDALNLTAEQLASAIGIPTAAPAT